VCLVLKVSARALVALDVGEAAAPMLALAPLPGEADSAVPPRPRATPPSLLSLPRSLAPSLPRSLAGVGKLNCYKSHFAPPPGALATPAAVGAPRRARADRAAGRFVSN